MLRLTSKSSFTLSKLRFEACTSLELYFLFISFVVHCRQNQKQAKKGTTLIKKLFLYHFFISFADNGAILHGLCRSNRNDEHKIAVYERDCFGRRVRHTPLSYNKRSKQTNASNI